MYLAELLTPRQIKAGESNGTTLWWDCADCGAKDAVISHVGIIDPTQGAAFGNLAIVGPPERMAPAMWCAACAAKRSGV